MENIEEYIKAHHDILDTELPSEGHLDRFQDKLQAQKKKNKQLWVRKYMQVAAIATLFVMSSLYVHSILTREENISPDSLEYYEAQYYYKTQVSQGIRSIESMQSVLTIEHKTLLIEELSVADAHFLELQEEMKTMPNDPRVLDAMVRHYRMKAEVINNILQDLEQVKHNNIKDEKVEI